MSGEPGAGFAGGRPAHAAPDRRCNAVGRLRSESAKPPPSWRSPTGCERPGGGRRVTGSIAAADRVPDAHAAAARNCLVRAGRHGSVEVPSADPRRTSPSPAMRSGRAPFELGQAVPELPAGADAELGEHLVQVVLRG